MGIVRVAKKEDQHKEHGGTGHGRINEARRIVAGVLHAHENDHGDQTGDGPTGLTAYERIRRVVALLGDDG